MIVISTAAMLFPIISLLQHDSVGRRYLCPTCPLVTLTVLKSLRNIAVVYMWHCCLHDLTANVNEPCMGCTISSFLPSLLHSREVGCNKHTLACSHQLFHVDATGSPNMVCMRLRLQPGCLP